MALLKDLWNFKTTGKKSLFYDNFDKLNNFFDNESASPEILLRIQVDALKKSYQGKKAVEQLNSFLNSLIGEAYKGTDNDLFAKLVQGINAGLNGWHNKNRSLKDWAQSDREATISNIEKLVRQLEEVVSNVNSADGKVSAPDVTKLTNLLKNNSTQAWQYYQAKGQYLENLGTWIVSQAGLNGLNTGNWKTMDSFFGESFNAQLIEDIQGLLLEDLTSIQKSSNSFINLSVSGYGKMNNQETVKANSELQAWVNEVLKLNGIKVNNGKVNISSSISTAQDFANLMRLINNENHSANLNITITLSEDIYKQIRNLGVNIQSKSNYRRHLMNKGNRQKYSMVNAPEYDLFKAFSVTDPVTEKSAVNDKKFTNQYEEFAAYVNLNLSKNILKTGYARNEFYLTTEGFSDLATLMERRSFYIRIADSALSYQQFLNNSFNTIYDS